MRQVLHIFRKDLRHFWPEAAITVLITAVFAWIYPAQWLPAVSVPLSLLGIPLAHASLQTVASFTTALIPIAWFTLTVRLVQDECLVGERPYWFTRPYEWPRLLAAKAAFLLLFAILPLAIAQAVLLERAGFSVIGQLPRLLLNVFVNTGSFLLPIFCLATVTRNFLRAALSFLALCVMVGGIAALSTYLPKVSIPYNDHISLPMIVAVCTVVVFVQYSARSTWLARSILGVLIVTLVIFAINPLESYLIDHTYYPPATLRDSQYVSLALAHDPKRKPRSYPDDKSHDNLTLPIDISGVPYGDTLEPDNAQLRIIAADGSAYTSPWHAFYNHAYTSATRNGTVEVLVDHAFLDKARKAPMTLELTVAITTLEAGPATQFKVPRTGDFTIPGFGLCTNHVESVLPSAGLHCLYPLAAPARTLVTAFASDSPCPADGSPPPDSFPLTGSAGSLKPDPVDDGLTSVWDTEVPFSYAGKEDTDQHNLPPTYLCPGSLVSFARMHVVRRFRTTISATNYSLAPAASDLSIVLRNSSGTP